jgi:hypothetical protein
VEGEVFNRCCIAYRDEKLSMLCAFFVRRLPPDSGITIIGKPVLFKKHHNTYDNLNTVIVGGTEYETTNWLSLLAY